MTTIRFTSLGVDAKVTVDTEGERRTLLSIAKQHGIPIPYRCEAGDCSACLVHVETLKRPPAGGAVNRERKPPLAGYVSTEPA